MKDKIEKYSKKSSIVVYLRNIIGVISMKLIDFSAR
jgi:hypothetical protein